VIELIGKLRDSNPQVRLDAVRELRDIEDPRTVEPLISALKDTDTRIRMNAATALGRTGDPRVIGPLTEALSDSDASVRTNVVKAMDEIKAALASRREGNGVDSNGETALIRASESGDLVAVQALLSKGVDVNERANDGETALIAASWSGHLEVVHALLAKGADISAKTWKGETALDAATHRSNNLVIMALLGSGADCDATSRPLTHFPNGFVLLKCSKIDFSAPNWLTDLMNRQIMKHANVYYELENQNLPVTGLMGFRGQVAQFKASVSGFAVILQVTPGHSILEYADVSPNCIIHRMPNGKGVLTLVIGATEWLLPDFDLQQASGSKNYVYRGRVIEYKSSEVE